MQKIWKENRSILVLFLLLWLSFFVWVLFVGKQASFLTINMKSSDFLDMTIPYSTYLGDGVFAAVIGLLFIFKNYRSAFILLSAFIISGLLAQFFKGVIFPDMLRPIAYFEQFNMDIHTIEGIKIRRNFSFPSGHTTTAFALFFSLIFIVKNKALHYLFLLLSVIAGYSRIYLGQHFPEDVIAGAMLGFITAVCSAYLWRKARWPFLDKKPFKK